MKYTIFSIDDRRKHYTDKIKPEGWTRVKTQCVDAINTRVVSPYPVRFEARRGHIGIWMTVLNALEQAPIVTFEDDALLGDDFEEAFKQRTSRLPKDFDFFSLFIPRNQDHLAPAEPKPLIPVYQTYGGVSMYYSEQGRDKIKALLKREGITHQYDDFLYHWAKQGELNGYTSHPLYPELVYISGMEDSIVQESEYL